MERLTGSDVYSIIFRMPCLGGPSQICKYGAHMCTQVATLLSTRVATLLPSCPYTKKRSHQDPCCSLISLVLLTASEPTKRARPSWFHTFPSFCGDHWIQWPSDPPCRCGHLSKYLGILRIPIFLSQLNLIPIYRHPALLTMFYKGIRGRGNEWADQWSSLDLKENESNMRESMRMFTTPARTTFINQGCSQTDTSETEASKLARKRWWICRTWPWKRSSIREKKLVNYANWKPT